MFIGIWFMPCMFAQFQIDGQFRIRPQLLHGYKKPVAKDAEPAFHIGQRTRLNLRYEKDGFKSLISLQDVRVWGDEDLVNPTGVMGKSTRTVDVYEAWVQFKLANNSFIKIGRQEMKYDDQRHISWRNWWDGGQTYDAVLFSYNDKKSGWQLDISGSFNSKALDLTGNDYSDGTRYFGKVNPILTHNFIYLKRSFSPKFYASLTLIGAGYQKEGTKNVIYMTMTEGIHVNYNMTKKATDGLFVKANAFIQNGANIQGKKVKAHMFTAVVGYRTMQKKLDINAGFEMLSGNDNYQTDPDYWKTDRTYNLLYGARHPYYEGYMDWFVVPKSALNGGITTFSLGLMYKLSKNSKLKLAYNNVSAANNIVKKDQGGNVVLQVDKGANLAQTFDMMHIKKFNKMVMMHTGFSFGIPSDEFNKMKGITDPGTNYFVYVMLTVKPVFYKSDKE
jgi:hypothetical protein